MLAFKEQFEDVAFKSFMDKFRAYIDFCGSNGFTEMVSRNTFKKQVA